MTAQMRDNDYYLKRLEKEHPDIHADWKAGIYASARDALIAAGLRKAPKPLNALKNAWSKANPAEQAEFLRWIGMTGGIATAAVSPSAAPATISAKQKSRTRSPSSRSTQPGSPVTPTGCLEPWAKVRIQQILDSRGIKPGAMMTEMGFKSLDPSLGQARRPHSTSTISNDMAVALVKWLDDNKAIK